MSNHASVCDHLLPTRLDAIKRYQPGRVKQVSRVMVCELRNMIVVGGKGRESAVGGTASTIQERSKGLFQERRPSVWTVA